MSDVGMFLSHSVAAADLKDGGENRVRNGFWHSRVVVVVVVVIDVGVVIV
jgi:hypothetical protein